MNCTMLVPAAILVLLASVFTDCLAPSFASAAVLACIMGVCLKLV